VEVVDKVRGIRGFHEKNGEQRKRFYSRDNEKRVRYFSNGKLFRYMAANWRDNIVFVANSEPPNSAEMPPLCR